MKKEVKKINGIADYAIAAVLLCTPLILNMHVTAVESIIMFAAGFAVGLQSIMTNYPAGILKVMPLRLHLLLHVMAGIFLCTSPWILNFAQKIFWPHLILGLLLIFYGVKSRLESEKD